MSSELRGSKLNGAWPLGTTAGKRLPPNVQFQRVGNLPRPIGNKIDAHRRRNALDEWIMPTQPLQFVTAGASSKQMVMWMKRLGDVVEFELA
jgi:hypothetical protein